MVVLPPTLAEAVMARDVDVSEQIMVKNRKSIIVIGACGACKYARL